MRVAMIGAGYVGLVSGACLADIGHVVTCVDRDDGKIQALRAGRMPIFEAGLESLVASNLARGRLAFSCDLATAVEQADMVFIAEGTPARRGDGDADLSYVRAAARDIAHALKGRTIVVTKSTVPVGTGDEVEAILNDLAPHSEVVVVSNPEFLREGSAIKDFQCPDRIVIGTDDPSARDAMRALYAPLEVRGAKLVMVGRRTAELTKYAANALLATKIGFINEIANLCERAGANVEEVAYGVGLDRRIGAAFLRAGPGFGGSCFPKDTMALLQMAHDLDSPMLIVDAVVRSNERRKRAMGRKVLQALGTNPRGRIAAILGLTFKADTDDMRDSPSLAIIQALQDAGVSVRAHDPQGMPQARAMVTDVAFYDDPIDMVTGADIAVLVTEWDVLSAIDLRALATRMRTPLLVDLRNVYSADAAVAAGLSYIPLGRAASMRSDDAVEQMAAE